MILLMLGKSSLPAECRILVRSSKLAYVAIGSCPADICREYTGIAALLFDQEVGAQTLAATQELKRGTRKPAVITCGLNFDVLRTSVVFQ